MYSSIWEADRGTNFRFGIRFGSFRFFLVSVYFWYFFFFRFVPVKYVIFKFSGNLLEWINY